MHFIPYIINTLVLLDQNNVCISTHNAIVSVTSHTRYAALACWPRPDLGRVRPTYQCVPSQRAPGVTFGSGVAPPPSSAARPEELGAGDSLPRAELSGVKSEPLLPAAARARSTRCRWFLARSAWSAQPSGPAAAERPSCPRDSRACHATREWVVGRGSLYYGYTYYGYTYYGYTYYGYTYCGYTYCGYTYYGASAPRISSRPSSTSRPSASRSCCCGERPGEGVSMPKSSAGPPLSRLGGGERAPPGRVMSKSISSGEAGLLGEAIEEAAAAAAAAPPPPPPAHGRTRPAAAAAAVAAAVARFAAASAAAAAAITPVSTAALGRRSRPRLSPVCAAARSAPASGASRTSLENATLEPAGGSLAGAAPAQGMTRCAAAAAVAAAAVARCAADSAASAAAASRLSPPALPIGWPPACSLPPVSIVGVEGRRAWKRSRPVSALTGARPSTHFWKCWLVGEAIAPGVYLRYMGLQRVYMGSQPSMHEVAAWLRTWSCSLGT